MPIANAKSDDAATLWRAKGFVSRAELKLADAVQAFGVDFRGKTVLDIGSSTGGFTDFALKKGAKKVIAVEKGTNQMSPFLRRDPRVELHEKTDIFDFKITSYPDIIMADVSFLSLTKVLKYAKMRLAGLHTVLLVMLKPQFEAKPFQLVDGVVKNHKIRREIIKNFEQTIKPHFKIHAKHDNATSGRYGNVERFYLLSLLPQNRTGALASKPPFHPLIVMG
ncbi:MAG: TlyA family RNA methyltransferase [Candidatus Nomurabacteria bacterium]|jgi:23S rRNA (cytidine1920-2'-O)/16S rRNA (cytidine1409-2'-O)-methyltransferase|nr:TlyA family RNA methyltransferase [Candidatus Nomurabacteria bacterium]